MTMKLHRTIQDRRNHSLPSYPNNGISGNTDIQEALSNFSSIWLGTISSESRYSNGQWSVLYTAKDIQTAIAECVFHLHKIYAPEFEDEKVISFQLIHYTTIFSGHIFNLIDSSYKISELVSPDYSVCHKIAKNNKNRYCAFLVPSARQHNGVCYPIFRKGAVKEIPEACIITVKIKKNGSNLSVYNKSGEFSVDIHDVYYDLGC